MILALCVMCVQCLKYTKKNVKTQLVSEQTDFYQAIIEYVQIISIRWSWRMTHPSIQQKLNSCGGCGDDCLVQYLKFEYTGNIVYYFKNQTLCYDIQNQID